MGNIQSNGAACNWCKGTPDAFIQYQAFSFLWEHAVNKHLQDSSFAPTELLCDVVAFSTRIVEALVPDRSQWSDVKLPGILLQLEVVGDSKRKKSYGLLYNEDGQPLLGPQGRQLRDIPNLPKEFPSNTPACLIEAYLRGTCDVQDIVDRWDKKIGRTAITQKTGRWRRQCEFPIFSWEHKRRTIAEAEVDVFARLTELQLQNNTGGIPVLPGFAVCPRPSSWRGRWTPTIVKVLTNGHPHQLGPRMARRKKVIEDFRGGQGHEVGAEIGAPSGSRLDSTAHSITASQAALTSQELSLRQKRPLDDDASPGQEPSIDSKRPFGQERSFDMTPFRPSQGSPITQEPLGGQAPYQELPTNRPQSAGQARPLSPSTLNNQWWS